jgi:hypothetical protein
MRGLQDGTLVLVFETQPKKAGKMLRRPSCSLVHQE